MRAHNEEDVGLLYKFVEEWERDDVLLSPDCCNSVEKEKDEDDAKERAFRKKYNACVLIKVTIEERYYFAINGEWVS